MCIFVAVMASVYCRCMINVLCLYFAQKPFSTLSRDACSKKSSSVNQERLSVLTKPREFEINILYHKSTLQAQLEQLMIFTCTGETGEGCYDFYKNVENSPFSTNKISDIFMVSNQTPSLLKDIINKILSLRD